MKTTVNEKGINDLVSNLDEVRQKFIDPRPLQYRLVAELCYSAIIHLMIKNREQQALIEELQRKQQTVVK